MIESLEIIKFQSHDYTMIDFDKGVNVIKGQSRSGKSATVRALRWALFNRPQGEGFKSHFADDKDPVEVSLSFTEDTWVTRSKGKVNQYYSDDLELKALRSDVPDEIKAITLIDDINFQSQGDPYFLIGETPGAAGKKLNEFVGLTIIDDSRSKINRLVNKVGLELNIVEEDIETTTERLKVEFKHLKKAESIVKFIDRSKDKLVDRTSKHDALDTLLASIMSKRRHIKANKKWLKVKKDHKRLVKQYNQAQDLRFKHDFIENACLTIRKHRTRRESTAIWLIDAKKQQSELTKQLDVCQTCGSERKYWRK